MTYDELQERINELVSKWSVLYPEYELVVISLPKKDPKQRKLLLKEIVRFLLRERFE
jgi:hypothetical protein